MSSQKSGIWKVSASFIFFLKVLESRFFFFLKGTHCCPPCSPTLTQQSLWPPICHVYCKMLRISLAFSVFQPWPWRGPSHADTYLCRICVPMSRKCSRSSLRSIESTLQSSYFTAQKHISPMYIMVSKCVSEKMPVEEHKETILKHQQKWHRGLRCQIMLQISLMQ